MDPLPSMPLSPVSAMNRLVYSSSLIVTTIMLFAFVASGCGGDDDCRSDHDCENTEQHERVCEPDGCRQSCDSDLDCAATEECVLRRVEQGRVCEATTDQFRSNNP